MHPQMVRLRCNVQRSAFEQERLFTVKQVEGPDYYGVAPAHFCFREDGTNFPIGQPGANDGVLGWVAARLVQNGGETAWVYLPSGETILVRAESIRPLGDFGYVPVGQ